MLHGKAWISVDRPSHEAATRRSAGFLERHQANASVGMEFTDDDLLKLMTRLDSPSSGSNLRAAA